MRQSEQRSNLPGEVRQWLDILRMLADSCRCSAQSTLAAELNVSASTLSRYLAGVRIPDRKFVENMLELAKKHDGSIDAAEVLAARDAAAEAHNRGRSADRNEPPVRESPRTGRRWFSRRVALVGMGTVLVAAALGGVLLMRDAGAADCTAQGCDGENHHDQGCDNRPRVLSTSPRLPDGSLVMLMYSNECQAVWARMVSAREGAEGELTDRDGNTQHVRLNTTVDEAVPRPTLMLGAPDGTSLRACVTVGGETGCTEEVTVPPSP